MVAKKKEIIDDLKFCKMLMDRLVDYANKNYIDENYWDNKHTVIQNDIIRLRRELNDIRKKLNWDYEEK